MRTGKGAPPIEIQVLLFAEQFHLAPWDVEANMTAKWWNWWLEYGETKRGRPKN